MRVLIPVAGVGTRLRPLTYTQPKPLIPVAGKPIISYIIDELIEFGVNEFVFVIGYLGEKIKHFIEEKYPDIQKEFIQQDKRKGLGHAVWIAKDAIADAQELFIAVGDTIFDTNVKEVLSAPTSAFAIKKVDDPRSFGVVEMNEFGFATAVKEKPRIPKSNMALIGMYKVKEVTQLIEALDFIVANKVKTLGEYQLTDAFMRMIDNGVQFKSIKVKNWYNCGKKSILLDTNAKLLKHQSQTKAPYIQMENGSIIIPPVSIGKNCSIIASIVGPNVTIGDNAKLERAICRDSIIGSYSVLEEVVLHQSVIGSDTSIKGLSQSFNIGDNTEIDFS